MVNDLTREDTSLSSIRHIVEDIKAPFGWGENSEDGKEGEENMVENGIFPCLVQERKQEGKKMVWKFFPPSPQNFFLPVWEEN